MSESLTMAKALNRGLRRALQADPKVLLAGEDIGKLGGVFRITEGLQAEFGENRVIDSPLAESGIVGTAVGLCMRGYRPVLEIQFDGFVFPGFAQIVTQVAKMNMRTGGQTPESWLSSSRGHEEAEIWFWLDADGRAVPVRLEGDAPIGSAVAELTALP